METQPTESHSRSLVKAFSWRVISLIITVAVVQIITGDAGIAAVVGAADALVKIGLYYLHERVWNRINLGRGPNPAEVAQVKPIAILGGTEKS